MVGSLGNSLSSEDSTERTNNRKPAFGWRQARMEPFEWLAN